MTGPGAFGALEGKAGWPARKRVIPPEDRCDEPAVPGDRALAMIGVAPVYACCGAPDADTRQTRICPTAGAWVNQHQPLSGARDTEGV